MMPNEKDPSFEQAFAPLAHFVFPDGCPEDTTDDDDDDDDEEYLFAPPDLSLVWPTRNHRRTISSKVALASIPLLYKVAINNGGLTPAQLWAVTLVACETLPKKRRQRTTLENDRELSTTTAATSSSLRNVNSNDDDDDASSKWFCDLVKCLLPRYKHDDDDDDNNSNNDEAYGIPLAVVMRLVSVAAATATACVAAQDSISSCSARGKVTVFRFLTLVIRTGSLRIDSGGNNSKKKKNVKTVFVNTCYAVLLPFVAQPDTCLDAVRLLHAMTRKRHVNIHRAQRLRAWWNAGFTTSSSNGGDGDATATATTITTNNNNNRLSPIWLLLQLYARYDPMGCGPFLPTSTSSRNANNNINAMVMGSNNSAWSKCFQIPDTKWEQDFMGTASQRAADSQRKTVDGMSRPAKRPRTTMTTDASSGQQQKRRHSEPSSSLTSALQWLHDAFDGVHSFSWGLVGNDRERRAIRASDLLMDKSLQQLILLSASTSSISFSPSRSIKSSNVADTEVVRLRTCLPFMLHEEWYHESSSNRRNPMAAEDNNNDNDEGNNVSVTVSFDQESRVESLQQSNWPDSLSSHGTLKADDLCSRLRLLRALASMAARANTLFPEAASFVLEEILPHWDGSDRMGLCLCHELLPKLAPCSFPELYSKVLRYLEPLFVYGSSRIQHAIASGALKGLIERWGQLDWPERSSLFNAAHGLRQQHHEQDEAKKQGSRNKLRTLREIVKWSDNMFLKAFLANDRNELLRLSVVDFFETVASISLTSVGADSFLAAPSPAIVYRLLLSQSVLSVDRVCALLVQYKHVFQMLKEAQQQRRGMDDSDSDQEVRGSDHIAIFNCFIWDFCCFLWKGSTLPSSSSSSTMSLHHAGRNARSTGNDDEARSKSICFTDLSPQALQYLHKKDATHVKWALSITHGSIFAGYVADFVARYKHELPSLSSSSAEASSPPQNDAIRGKLKVKYLDYLKNEHGLEGIHAFLTTFVSSLVARQQARQRRALLATTTTTTRKETYHN